MPGGVTWTKYLSVTAAALLSMFAGAQVVHHFYRPLEDIDTLVQQEVDRRVKIRLEASTE